VSTWSAPPDTPALDEGTVHFHVLGNLRGSGPFPFFVENVNATVVTTNPIWPPAAP
jgi:hypothetical protein